MFSIRMVNSTLGYRRPDAPRLAIGPVLRGALAVGLLLVSAAAAAQKPPTLIRQHLLENPDKEIAEVKSVEPHQGEVLDALLSTRIWKVAYSRKDQDGESLQFMAVTDDGDVLRVYDFDQPAVRANFVKLLPEGFRVQSAEDARRLVAATLELYFGFPFSEPEMTADEMRMEQRGNDYFFIDGERFGDATGYRVSIDDEGRVVGYEYSWELPVAPAGD